MLRLGILLAAVAVSSSAFASEAMTALVRCAQCLDHSCEKDGQLYADQNDLGTHRWVATKSTDGKKSYMAYQFASDALLVAPEPPARRVVSGKGKVPGFFLYVKDTSYFCPTYQIAGIWEGRNGASIVKLQTSGGFEQIISVKREAKNGSLAEVWNVKEAELKPAVKNAMPVIKCVDDMDQGEKVSADNPFHVLADYTRFEMIERAKFICGRAVPNERNIFLNSLVNGCDRQKDLPFSMMLHREAARARDIVTSPGCKRGFWDKLEVQPKDPILEKAEAAGIKLPKASNEAK